MALIEQVASVIQNVPEQWREDFCLLIEGETPSEEFRAFFDKDLVCQRYAERVIRLVDQDLVSHLVEAQVGKP